MPSRTSRTPGADPAGSELDQERLLSAAVRLAGELPAARAVVGVLRGGSADHERAVTLCRRLTNQGVRSVELSPVPSTERSPRAPRSRQRPRVHFLLYAGGSLRDQAYAPRPCGTCPCSSNAHRTGVLPN